MAISLTNLTADSSVAAASSFNTASITPSANHLILCSITARRSDSTQVTAPTVTGNSLTWVEITERQYDPDSGTRKSIFLFRAMGSPSTGAVTLDFGVQSITAINWAVDDVSGTDTTGTNGSGAIVQFASNDAGTAGTATGLTVTLAAFSNTANGTFGTLANDAPNTWTVGSGFTQGSTTTSASIALLTEWKNTNDTTVDGTFTNVAGVRVGGIAIEIAVPSLIDIGDFQDSIGSVLARHNKIEIVGY